MARTTPATTRRPKAKPPKAEDELDLSGGLDDLFVSLSDEDEYINILLYGKEGSGKSTAAARLVNSKPEGQLLMINAEGGLKIKALRKQGVDVDRIKVWPDPKKPERVTHKSLDKIYRMMKAELETNPDAWIGVVFDSATEIYQSMLDFVQNKRVTNIRNQGRDADEFFVDIADYGEMSKMMRDQMRKFRDLPCHFIYTALERRTVDKDTGKPTYGPDVTPALQSDLLGYADFVLMMKSEDEDGPYRALTKSNSRYRAKDRFNVLPRILVEPMADRVLAYLNDDLTEDTDPFQDDLPQAAIDSLTKKKAGKGDDDDDTDEMEDDE